MKKRLFVMDIDDTITKSEFQHQLSYVNTMKSFGILNINQNWASYKHHTDSYILKENYENNMSDQFDFSFIPEFEDRMSSAILELPETTEIKGAAKALERIRNYSNYAICFATGSLLKPALIKLKQAGIKHADETVVGSNELFERESIVQAAIDKSKEITRIDEFEEIIAVGDGIWDLNAAKNLNIHFIGIGDKNLPQFELAGIKAHISNWDNFVLEDLEDSLGIGRKLTKDQ